MMGGKRIATRADPTGGSWAERVTAVTSTSNHEHPPATAAAVTSAHKAASSFPAARGGLMGGAEASR